MSSNYYDIDAILTDAQKIPCTFHLHIPNLGYLESPTTRDIHPNSTLLLPLWLAEFLALSQPSTSSSTPLITLDLPPALSPRVQNALKADPRSVDLRSLATHFYALGCRVLQLFEEEELGDILAESFKVRAREVADHAHNPRGALGEGADFLRGLDEMERQVFRAAHESAKQMKAFMADRSGRK
ncbi:hypothetical protein BDZ91DRAFT_195997 [Kalaharituber pfeilii]|nr:hypothetical protein BDZ91DRAFT_195997 [Kalaharituber pfeilii]